jgi:Tfp pilus assembly PilM family ATPase
VQVGVAQRLVVDSLYKTFCDLGLDAAVFELESQAIVRALISKSLRKKKGLLVVDLGGTATNVVVHDRGAMRFTASLQKGIQYVASNLTPDDMKIVVADMRKLDAKTAERLKPLMMPAMGELVKEVRGIVDFYNGIDSKHEVMEIIVTGGGSNIPGLDEVFLQYFSNVHVQRGNPWVNILSGTRLTHPPMDIKESARFSTALGLALRQVIV